MNDKMNMISGKIYLVNINMRYDNRFIGRYIGCDDILLNNIHYFNLIFSNVYKLLKNENELLLSSRVKNDSIPLNMIKSAIETKYSDYLSDEQMIELLL